MNHELEYRLIKPNPEIADFVYCFSSLKNLSNQKEGVIIPNGKIDLIFYQTLDNQLRTTLMGLETKPKAIPKLDITAFFAISFHPLALEYILHQSIAEFVDSGMELPNYFWDFNSDDLDNFEAFCEKASRKIYSLLPQKIDGRKLELFNLILETDGEINIKELSEKIVWEERQINRYFKKYLGISLKYYCNILRFQSSLFHIKDGNLYPQLNFTDQSHFIKEIKKLSGVSPKELFKNQNDRFLQFLVYHTK